MKQILVGFFVILLFVCVNTSANAQRTQTAKAFRAEVSKVTAGINSAYKKRRLTRKEYDKLINEIGNIHQAIDKAMIDDFLTPKEKNSINSKISGAKNKLHKYQHNREIY